MWRLLAVAAASVCAALWLVRRPLARWRRLVAASAQLPGPLLPRLSLGDPLAEVAAICRRYGTPCRLWVGPRLYVLLSDPEHAEAVLGGSAFHQREPCPCQVDVVQPFTGGGLVTAETEHGWQLRRRLVVQTLTPQWVHSQCGWLQTVAGRLVAALQQQQQQQKEAKAEAEVEEAVLVRELGACTLDALAGSLLGQQARATGRPSAGFPHHFLQAAELLSRQAGQLVLSLLPRPLWALTAAGREEARLVRQLHGHIDAAVDNAAHSSTRDQESHIALSWERAAEAGDDPDRLSGSVLELLLGLAEAEAELGAEERRRLVRDELASLLLAGQTATQQALLSTLHLLALHPEVQSEAARDQEVLRRAVLESLRLAPVTPLLGRRLCHEVEVSLPAPGERGAPVPLRLPAGCTAVVCAPLTHRHPAHWPQPDAFQPDRFLEEREARRHPFAYLAFGGGGPRRCPGGELALQQVCAALSSLLAAYRVVTTASREDLHELRMRTRHSRLRLVPRA